MLCYDFECNRALRPLQIGIELSKDENIVNWVRCIIRTSAWYTIYDRPRMAFRVRVRVRVVTMVCDWTV